jgi:hypothetical protein
VAPSSRRLSPAGPPPPLPAGVEQAAVDTWLEANVSLIAYNK